MSTPVNISLTVNGEMVSRNVTPRETLADFLRISLELTGTHMGCEIGCLRRLPRPSGWSGRSLLPDVCGAGGRFCRRDNEGLTERAVIADIQDAFHQRNALQCGFCTPGMLMTAYALLSRPGIPSRDDIRDALSGNYCRCTGYESIVDAIETVARPSGIGGPAT